MDATVSGRKSNPPTVKLRSESKNIKRQKSASALVILNKIMYSLGKVFMEGLLCCSMGTLALNLMPGGVKRQKQGTWCGLTHVVVWPRPSRLACNAFCGHYG